LSDPLSQLDILPNNILNAVINKGKNTLGISADFYTNKATQVGDGSAEVPLGIDMHVSDDLPLVDTSTHIYTDSIQLPVEATMGEKTRRWDIAVSDIESTLLDKFNDVL